MPRLPVPPGLHCPDCHQPFNGALARRTTSGYVHAVPCVSPTELTEGTWVTVNGIARWQPDTGAA